MKQIIVVGYLAVAVFLTFKVITLSNQKQQLLYEYAEINSVRYGLFDVDKWKDKVADIIVKKIDEYEITAENKEYIKGHIEAGFYKLLDELASFLEQEQKTGNWFNQVIKKVVYGIAFDKESFQQQVPKWADEVIKLIENPTTKRQIKNHLKTRIVQLISQSESLNYTVVYDNILAKYKKNNLEECNSFLKYEIKQTNDDILFFSYFLIAMCVLPFFKAFRYSNPHQVVSVKIILLMMLLFVGISIPMLSIDVRIEKFVLMLLGEEINFLNQVLYFQTKSIIQVVKIMMLSGEFNAIFTGFFIFLFSVVLPFVKLICIFWESQKGFQTNFTNAFVNKLGKWSMADVMVVAIFLAFLGINSLLNDLLELTEQIKGYMTIIPNNNHSNLEIGVIYFIFYVVFSLLTRPARFF
ncbi:paraquat-inducible protein A [Capnocytophaga canimorsus]|uniref:paraquat-inducible protein A n=1 Tax=Capnocytophaga canimorsus TaxID=28188 RepID=UPI00385158A1